MRVLLITSMLPVERDQGLGAFVASQIEAIRALGVLVDVEFLDIQRSKCELVRGIRDVRRKLRTGRYDLAHVHFGYNGIPACLQSKIPVVVSFCGTDLASPKFRTISRWVSRRAEACIVKSVEMQQYLDVPSIVIPNGIDMERFRPISRRQARKTLGLSEEKRYVLFISNPERPEKRFALANDAIKRVRGKGKEVEPLVVFNKPHSELPTYMNAADLLILTSSREGSPNTIKEAMACNLPIVSTDVGDVRKVIGGTENCVLAEASPDDIANGIEQILDTSRRTNGRLNMEALSSVAISHRVVHIYQNVVERRS